MAGPLKLKATIRAGEHTMQFWSDLDSLKKQVKKFGKVGIARANARALNRAANKAKTFTGKLLQKDFNIKARSVSTKLRVNPRASPGRGDVAIYGRSTKLSLYKHTRNKPRQTALGVRYNAGGGNAVHRHQFIAVMPSGHTGVFVRKHRTGTKRGKSISPTTGKRVQSQLAIREIEYPSVAHMITNDSRANSIFDFFINDYPRQLHSQLDHEVKKSQGVT